MTGIVGFSYYHGYQPKPKTDGATKKDFSQDQNGIGPGEPLIDPNTRLNPTMEKNTGGANGKTIGNA